MNITHCVVKYIHQAVEKLDLRTKKVYRELKNVHYAMKNSEYILKLEYHIMKRLYLVIKYTDHTMKNIKTHKRKCTSLKSISFLTIYHDYPHSICRVKTLAAHEPMTSET